MIIKKAIALCCAFVIGLATASAVYAEPDESYTYSFWGEPVPAPAPYTTARIWFGSDLLVGDLNVPQDLFVSPQGQVVIADTGNNRIIMLDEQWKVQRVIESFDHNGQTDAFNQPEGVFVDTAGQLYVADTFNRRIVQLNADGQFVKAIAAPESNLIRAGFEYTPIKVAADAEGQVYVISRGSYEGVMEFNADGMFEGFIGTNRVRFNPVDLLWKRISTKEQRDQMQQFIPLEFNNIDLDDEGFLFTTTSEETADKPIKRMNPSGIDILRSKGYSVPKGDLSVSQTSSAPGSSIFIDVASDKGGIYHALDSKRGRIFSYDKDGNLLYVSGGRGSQQGKFRTPIAVAMKDDRMLVLDKDLARITELAPTEYGRAIRGAVQNMYDGRVDEATLDWQRVLAMNSNFDVAYIGIGKSLMKKGDYEAAMRYFKLGNHRENYSEAFKQYRKEIVINHFGTIVLMVVLGAAACVTAIRMSRQHTALRHYDNVGIARNPFYTMIHPFNGFWEMKYEQKGRLTIAFLLLGLLTIFTIVKQQFSGFVVNFNQSSKLNSLEELLYILLPFLLWCVANWSLTTLMDGEGKFKDIVMATGYAMLPLVIIFLPQTLISTLMTNGESPFYYLLDVIAYGWSLWLLFVGTMTVHQYSPGKTIATMLLTLIVIGIIVFLSILFFSMMQQMINFAISIYRELSFRL
ncbi:YIP1 family protein [Paenibacillus marinisediminis]